MDAQVPRVLVVGSWAAMELSTVLASLHASKLPSLTSRVSKMNSAEVLKGVEEAHSSELLCFTGAEEAGLRSHADADMRIGGARLRLELHKELGEGIQEPNSFPLTVSALWEVRRRIARVSELATFCF